MHGMDKNAKVYYNLFIKSSTGEQHSLRNTQQRAKLPGHSSFLAELQARCQWGPRVPGVGLAMIQGQIVVPRVICVFGSDGGSQRLPAPGSCLGSQEAAPLGSGPHCVWKQLCDLEQVLWPPWSSAFSFLGKVLT